MVPMCQAGYEHSLEVGHDGVERLGIFRRMNRQCRGNVAGLHASENWILLGMLEVLCYPVNQLVAVSAKRRGIHVDM